MRYLAPLLLTIWALTIFTASAWRGVAEAQGPAHDPSKWHPPAFGHEHGDPVPAWLASFLATTPYNQWWTAGFDGDFNTSPAENTTKHAAMKGMHLFWPAFTDQDGGWIDGYLRMHIASNAMDRGAQNHSVTIFIADAGGNLTIRQGWINAGSVETARVPKRCANTNSDADCNQYYPVPRPVVLEIDALTFSRGDVHEQWYSEGAGFFFGWGIDSTTVKLPGEKASDTDPHAWHLTGQKGNSRRIEVTAPKPTYPGVAWWGTPLGTYATDPSSPECIPTKCLLNAISPTYKGVKGSFQRVWPVPSDWALPN